MCGAVSARARRRAATNSGDRFFCKIFVCVVISGEARHDCFSPYHAESDVVWLQVALPSYWGMQLQIPKRLTMVVSRWSWVAIGGAVLLGNATVGS